MTRRTIHQMNRARPAKPPAAGTIERRYNGNPSAAHRVTAWTGVRPAPFAAFPTWMLKIFWPIVARRPPVQKSDEIGEADERERDVQGGAADRGVHGRDGAVGAHGRPSVAERGADDRSDDPDEEAVDEVGDEAGRRIRVAQAGCARDRRGDGGRRVGPHDRTAGSARWRRSRGRGPRQRFALRREGGWRRGFSRCPRIARGRFGSAEQGPAASLLEVGSPPTEVVFVSAPGSGRAGGSGGARRSGLARSSGAPVTGAWVKARPGGRSGLRFVDQSPNPLFGLHAKPGLGTTAFRPFLTKL